MGRGCSVEGCDLRHQARGLCMKHYLRWWRIKDSMPSEEWPDLVGEPV